MATKEELKYIKMTTTKEWKLVLQLAVPTMISMLITMIYNTADTFFVSRISVAASGATGIVFSLMAILQAFGFMYGHGAGSNISRLLGARNTEHASIYASTSVFLAVGTGLLIGLFGLLFLEPFMRLLGSTDTILPEAKAYAMFILIAAPAMTTSCVLNNILRYEGIAVYAMIGLTSGGILNMALDPLFIFTFHLGTAGAGLATAVSQYIAVIILLLPYLRGKTVTRLALRSFTKTPADIRNIVLTGMPSMMRQGLTSIGTALLNTQAAVYGDAAIAAVSIVNRCTGLMFSLALGMGQGFQPVCAFNYGAKKYDRVRRALLFTMGAAFVLLGSMTTVCRCFAPEVIQLFRKDADVVSIGTETLRYACTGLLFLPVCAMGSMLFQSTGKKWRAMLIAMLQSGALFIPMVMILPHFCGLKGLEMAQPTAYFAASLIALPIILLFLRTLRQKPSELA